MFILYTNVICKLIANAVKIVLEDMWCLVLASLLLSNRVWFNVHAGL